MIFVSILFMATGTTFPFFESQEEIAVEFDYSGQNTTIFFEEQDVQNNVGWAVYSFGEYLDDDKDGFWDHCENFQITFLNDSEWNFFYPTCENSTQREDVENMIYIGQICFDSINESSPECHVGNYSLESNIFVRLSREDSKDERSSFISRFLEWFSDGLVSGQSILCGGTFLLLIGLVSSLLLMNDQEEDTTKKKDGSIAEWRAYSLSGQERGDDGMPKAFSRHSEKKEIYRKPRKGNVRGGVHKSGGLYLDGWTDADSDAAYKKKVEDRREE